MTRLRRHLPTILGLLALLVFAAWLRWRYATEISLYVDEFTTLWAAKRVMASGVPIMPSGVLYTRGLLATYVTALAGLLAGGLTYTVGRLPSLLFGLACIVAIFAAGRREWNSRVGWLAALGLALLPEAIVWSARARFYAQLQLFALLTMWAAYAAIQYRGARRGTRSGGTIARRSGGARSAGPHAPTRSFGAPPSSLRRTVRPCPLLARADGAPLSLHLACNAGVARLALSPSPAGLARPGHLPGCDGRALCDRDPGPARLL